MFNSGRMSVLRTRKNMNIVLPSANIRYSAEKRKSRKTWIRSGRLVIPVAAALLETEEVGKGGCVRRNPEAVGLPVTHRHP